MTNIWAPSPSPSSESAPSCSTLSLSWNLALTLPYRLWHTYVTHLYHYQPNSWVGRVASTFRVLAIMLLLPVVLLTLLDVTSYVIARTLGVVDDVKASTSDTDTTADDRRATVAVAVPVSERVPTSFSSERPARGSEGLAPEDSGETRPGEEGHGHCGVSETAVCAVSATVQKQARNQGQGQQIGTQTWTQTQAGTCALDVLPHSYYFAGEDDLRLAGEGVFSPAVSGPPSPIIPSYTLTEIDDGGSRQASEEEGILLRRRVQAVREDELVHT